VSLNSAVRNLHIAGVYVINSFGGGANIDLRENTELLPIAIENQDLLMIKLLLAAGSLVLLDLFMLAQRMDKTDKFGICNVLKRSKDGTLNFSNKAIPWFPEILPKHFHNSVTTVDLSTNQLTSPPPSYVCLPPSPASPPSIYPKTHSTYLKTPLTRFPSPFSLNSRASGI
jgi:hypothetical protein